MTFRLFAGLLAVALTTTSATVAAQDRWTDDDLRVQVRSILRDVLRDVRHVVRDARLIARDVSREVDRAVRDLDRDLAHFGQDSQARRDRQRALREQRDQARARARAARDAARDERDREREARRFAQVSPTGDPCARDDDWGSRGRACEVRDTRLPAPGGPLSVDASPNGGIRVEGWDQPDVLVRAVVRTQGDTEDDARALLPRVAVTAAGTTVSAQGPDRDDLGRRSGWSVSFQIWAPRRTALALTARNGGVTIFGMRGESRFTTENGGVTLNDVGGQVAGHTRNGGVTVRLSGQRWEGAGLDVETTNGGVSLTIPQGYSAALEVGTVNGGINTDVPMTVQGRVGRELRATLGAGGPLVKVRTTNGGVRIVER